MNRKNLPPRPVRPEPPSRDAKRSLLPVVLVLVPMAIALLGIVALTGRAGLLMVAAIACIPAFMALHYVLWGRWLLKSIKNQAPPEDE